MSSAAGELRVPYAYGVPPFPLPMGAMRKRAAVLFPEKKLQIRPTVHAAKVKFVAYFPT